MTLKQKLNYIGSLPSHQLEQINSNASRLIDINILDGLCEDLNPNNKEDYGESFDEGDIDTDYNDIYSNLQNFTKRYSHPTKIEQLIATLLHSALEAVDDNNYELLLSADSLLGGMGG